MVVILSNMVAICNRFAQISNGNPSHATNTHYQIIYFSASSRSQSLKSGWAILIKASTRWLTLRPRSHAMPYSVTTWSTSFREVVITVPSSCIGTILERSIWLPAASIVVQVECRATMGLPPVHKKYSHDPESAPAAGADPFLLLIQCFESLQQKSSFLFSFHSTI